MLSSDADRLERLEKAVGRLPRTTREIFIARRVDRLSYEEIAERTGLSEPQIQRHMARAIAKLVRLTDDEPLSWWQRLLRG